MKKIVIISLLFVLIGVLILTGCAQTVTGQTDENSVHQEALEPSDPSAYQEVLEPSDPDESVDQPTLPETTKISLDFTRQSNGRLAYQVDFGSKEPDTWIDQIYTDSVVVNSDRIMLVPKSGDTELPGGWCEDHSVFVSPSESIQLYATGLEPGVLYRVALFVPQEKDNVGDSTGVHYGSAVCQEEGESTLVCTAPISCYPGLYRDVTVVISGNDEVYTHTFDVQIQNVSQNRIEERERGLRNGLYFARYQNLSAPYVRKAGPVTSDSIIRPSSGISIAAPLDKDVYTGYDGAGALECIIALDSGYSPEKDWQFEIPYRLTERATGQEIYSGTSYEYLNGGEEVSWLTTDIYVSWLEEKEYCLSLEVIRSEWDSERGEYVDVVSLGADTVIFSVEKEVDPSEIYARYLGYDELRFYLYGGENYYWNEDNSQLTFHASTREFEFYLSGIDYGEIYRYALIQESERSGQMTATPILQTAQGQYGGVCVDMTDLLTDSGEAVEMTLLAYGGGKCTAHTFAANVNSYQEYEDYGTQRESSGGSNRDLFVWKNGQSENQTQPQTGYTVGIPDGTVLSGYVGNELYVPIAFSSEFHGVQTVSLSLAEESTGRMIGEKDVDINLDDPNHRSAYLVVTNDFDPGAHILRVSADGKQTEVRVILEKEQTPLEAYTEYKAKMGVIGELSEQGVTVYENPEEAIVPEIKDYLASMQSFDTDMFQQFLRYRYGESEGMISSFALISPNVPESEQVIDREDLLFTANWLLRDFYAFQSEKMIHYTDAQVIDLDRMDTFFNSDWKELMAMDYATGATRDSDGTIYIWLPVYYEDEQGSLANNELYLFVYILNQGADTAYLDATNFYNPEFYNDYRTTQLLITDQKVVADMVNKLNRARSVLYMPTDANDYPYLYQNDRGEYVRRVQRRLQRLGYLTTSVDAVFTPSVMEAVQAWQKDMGMEERWAVTPEMQRLLHDSTPYRNLLVDWLKDHS